MEPVEALSHPFALEEGRTYLRREPGTGSTGWFTRLVKLVAYDACPAFVIVEDGGNRKRCPREELFALGATTNAILNRSRYDKYHPIT